MKSLRATHDRLRSIWESLQRKWHASRDLWNDPMRRQFEREFWQPLETQMQATLKEMERLAKVVSQTQRNVR